MPNVSTLMTADVQVVGPQESLRRAAVLMYELDIGALPVCDGGRLLGMLTDRDITVRGVALGLDPDKSCVSDVMSERVEFCMEDQDREDALRLMGDCQVRRLPVLDTERKLVGIVSLADLALSPDVELDVTLRQISSPGGQTSQSAP